MSTVYTRYKRPGDFDVLSSTVRDLKMVQQETRKLDGQCVDFCDVLKDRCCFFSQTDCMPKTVRWNVQKNYRRTATRAVSTDCLWEFIYRCYTVSPFVFNACIMLRTIRESVLNKNPKKLRRSKILL